jgi:type F conjugative transfer system protein TrbI
MNRNQENGFQGVQVAEQASQPAVSGPPPTETGNTPYVPQKEKPKSSLKDNARILAIGAGLVVVILLLAFQGISHQYLPAKKAPATKSSRSQTQSANSDHSSASITPIMETGRTPAQESDASQVSPDQIAQTATKAPKPSAGKDLASVAPFEAPQQWQPAPYQAPAQPVNNTEPSAASPINTNVRGERDSLDKASLVFVRSVPATAAASRAQPTVIAPDLGIGLAPGTRLRARLEAAVTTAVRTPVVAVIEYNYEQNGEIVVPAGAKAFGHLEAADRSGYLGIRFDSLLMPDGSTVALEAAATNLQLQPLRGKVEGKHTGKNILVRFFAGVGEIAATLVGRGSLNQPLSEGDLLRERVTNNIGQASDQTVANLALTEHIIVSVPANTEIYVVLQKPAKQAVNESDTQSPSLRPASQDNIDELRQLLQLQREMNQSLTTKAGQE